MRTERSVKNIIAALVTYCVTLVFGFIARSYFAKLLGEEYLGINSLFTNIISVMSVVELGFGSAIIYNLYRPLSENNHEQVKSLIKYYKKVYNIIAVIVFVIGIIILPFIPLVVGKVTVSINLYFAFILFVVDSSSSYLLTYKRSIFYADQKNYVINLIHALMFACINLFQIITLILWKNYIIFLTLQIVLHLIENIVISIMANKKYPYLLDKKIESLDEKTKNDIIHKVKGLIYHQIGSSIVMGTDNIIISMTKTLGVIAVGKYSNYVMVINNINSMTSQIFSSVTASVGNLIIEKNNEDVYLVYKRILFLNAALSNFVCASLFACFDPLITVWVGEKYILSVYVVIVIVANFYVQGMKRTCGIFKNASGIFYEDRHVPLAEAIINLIVSVLMAYLIGLSGVILGTMISSMVHWLYDFPKYVYGLVLKKDVKQYLKDYVPYICVFIISVILTRVVCTYPGQYLGPWSLLITDVIICFFVPNFVFLLFFNKKQEFYYWKNFVFAGIMKLLKK